MLHCQENKHMSALRISCKAAAIQQELPNLVHCAVIAPDMVQRRQVLLLSLKPVEQCYPKLQLLCKAEPWCMSTAAIWGLPFRSEAHVHLDLCFCQCALLMSH